MNLHDEKINLLTEMIAFAIVDGRLHEREYTFLSIVACELGVSKDTLNDLFHREISPLAIKSEFQRVQQFYRLALLMHVDGVLHHKEEVAIKQIAINMGLNPVVTRRILELIKASPTKILDPYLVLNAFKEQHN